MAVSIDLFLHCPTASKVVHASSHCSHVTRNLIHHELAAEKKTK